MVCDVRSSDRRPLLISVFRQERKQKVESEKVQRQEERMQHIKERSSGKKARKEGKSPLKKKHRPGFEGKQH